MIPYLRPLDPFPPVESAREDMGGLLAVGGSLAPDRILAAYRFGIFPWGTVDGLPLWYSPDPRMVLCPVAIRRSRTKRMRRGSGQGDPLLLAAGQFMRIFVALPMQADRGQQLADTQMGVFHRLATEA